MHKILSGNGKNIGTWLAQSDDNFISVLDTLIKLADSDITLKGYATPATDEPASPTENDCYLVIETGTIWELSATENEIIRYDGSGWEILPYKITELQAELSGDVIVTETENFTFGSAHKNNIVRVSNVYNIYVTIPNDTTHDFPVGTRGKLRQAGAGTVVVQAEESESETVTLNAYNNGLSTEGQFADVDILKVGANEWDVMGGVPFEIAMDTINLRNMNLPADEIDERLEYHANRIEEVDEGLREAFVFENYGANAIDIRGNENPTAASADARQTLKDNYVLVTYNPGFSE
jgi:hypothetical protein